MSVPGKKIFAGVLAVSVVAALACGYYIFKKAMARPSLPVLGQVRPFQFTDSSGRPYDSQGLYRNVWIAGVFSTPCLDGCEQMMKNMASLSRTFEQVPAVKLIAVTLNPAADTPQVLDAYSRQFVQGKGNWAFLTGPQAQVETFYHEQLKLPVAIGEGRYSPMLALVDRSGYIRGYYDGTVMADINQLFIDATQLLRERF